MKFLYLKGMDIFGPLEAEQITKEENFSEDLLVCPEDKAEQEAAWKPVSHYADFKAFLGKESSTVKDENVKPQIEEQPIVKESFDAFQITEQKNDDVSQDLPPLEDTETETETTETEPEEFSFQQVMNDMADKEPDADFDENEDIQDHTFHIANKEDNLLEDLPAHSLLGAEENEDSSSESNNQNQAGNVEPKPNSEIRETSNVQSNKEFLEISNNKIISSSDGRVKKQRPNDLLFILSFLVLMVVAIALCMAFWNMMSGNKDVSQQENTQTQNVVQPRETDQNTSFGPEVSKQKSTDLEVNKEIPEVQTVTEEEQVINIVKNTKLKNKGTIGEYLDRVYGGEYQSSWSAKPFTDNVYIVEFFASQVRSEPYVYLFRVDLDQKKITGALNNITLDLLA